MVVAVVVGENGSQMVVVDDYKVVETVDLSGWSPGTRRGDIVQSHHPTLGAVFVEIEHYTLAAVGICDYLTQMIPLGIQSQCSS